MCIKRADTVWIRFGYGVDRGLSAGIVNLNHYVYSKAPWGKVEGRRMKDKVGGSVVVGG